MTLTDPRRRVLTLNDPRTLTDPGGGGFLKLALTSWPFPDPNRATAVIPRHVMHTADYADARCRTVHPSVCPSVCHTPVFCRKV